MSLSSIALDVYQLTTLFAHAAEGRLEEGDFGMSFFFRRLPKGRNYVVSCGERSILEYCETVSFEKAELDFLASHPVLKEQFLTPLGARIRDGLSKIQGFDGEIDMMPEGTLAFAGPAQKSDGSPFLIDGIPLSAYTPLAQVQCNLLYCKLIETPWLSRLNHLSMVATKAARVVSAACEDGVNRPVIEFGQRRTHSQAAIDASYAAFVGGCRATSNLAASYRYGIPSVGTMDHFAVLACERLLSSSSETETGFFRRFWQLFPDQANLLVDTYDTWRGIKNAVCATDGKLLGVRLDSAVTPAAVRKARKLLDDLGAPNAKLFLSDGLDEYRVRELAEAGGDGFGVGENIVCSPDASAGVGAVGKLVRLPNGKLTMKWSRGSAKATLPGMLQVYRFSDHDVLALRDEEPPKGGTPILRPFWRGKKCVAALRTPLETQEYVKEQLARLPKQLRCLETAQPNTPLGPWPIHLSAHLERVIEDLYRSNFTPPA